MRGTSPREAIENRGGIRLSARIFAIRAGANVASVELRGLTKRYGDVAVVDDVSLTIEHGRLVCLLGPSGCGKTTTLRLIAGFVEPTAGEIRVGNQLVSSPARTLAPERRNMSMIFQSYALWPHMTVAANVAYGLELRKLDRETVKRKLSAILATTQLSALADRYPGELSGGQQQRVALARALIVEPETLLLDEPLSNLDANLREEMRFEVRRLHDEYRYTTVYVTHDQAEAMTTADVIAVMNGGRIEQAGSPEEVYDRPRSEFVARFIGASNILKGKALDDSHLAVGETVLRCTGVRLAPGDGGAISVRQHVIRLWAAAPQSMENVIAGTVLRQVFLGNSRDYVVAAADGTQLRVVTSPAENVARGQPVWLYLPPERCRVLNG
ncbi:MAG TPA: ABC transporter ATP-binding protein [Xanthobacteraceae bacterium]|jgi:iron(III) transport system ATP-binding protein